MFIILKSSLRLSCHHCLLSAGLVGRSLLVFSFSFCCRCCFSNAFHAYPFTTSTISESCATAITISVWPPCGALHWCLGCYLGGTPLSHKYSPLDTLTCIKTYLYFPYWSFLEFSLLLTLSPWLVVPSPYRSSPTTAHVMHRQGCDRSSQWHIRVNTI